MKNHRFSGNRRLGEEAEYLDEKARSIRMKEGKGFIVEYRFNPITDRFWGFAVIPDSNDRYGYSVRCQYREVIDMSIPCANRRYGEFEHRLFLSCMKTNVFKNPSLNITRGLCEQFFENRDNFADVVLSVTVPL